MIVGSVVEWSKSAVIVIDMTSITYSRHSVVSLGKTLYAFAAFFSAWLLWLEVLNFRHVFIKLLNQTKKLQLDSNILASLETGRGNCLLISLCIAPATFSASQKDKYRNEVKRKASFSAMDLRITLSVWFFRVRCDSEPRNSLVRRQLTLFKTLVNINTA